jgi:hypothetical protein
VRDKEIIMLTRTEYAVMVTSHMRRVEHANKLGWLYDAGTAVIPDSAVPVPNWLTRRIAHLCRARRTPAAASV